MPIITSTVFIGEISIANRDQPAVQSAIAIFIAKYEPKFLKQLMGETMYADYLLGIAEDPIPEKWVTLQNLCKPALASYVYYWYIRDQVSQTVGMGQVKPAGENGTIVTPMYKMVRAWNEMVDEVHEIAKYIHAHPDDYGTYYTYWNYWGWWGNTYCCRYRPEIFYPINTMNI